MKTQNNTTYDRVDASYMADAFSTLKKVMQLLDIYKIIIRINDAIVS